ncbi:TlyA family RNA methyltransferase [bacterium]|nr:TlyA family RNA methyltransferase [candidate division CSSED10-310 bacterium]
MNDRERLDRRLVASGRFSSGERARHAIRAGWVRIDDRPVLKPGIKVAPDAIISCTVPLEHYVGRGGAKLAAALDEFSITVTGAVALDVGSSTGGFTECLLRRGARRVYCLDVGHGQMHPGLAADPRVIQLEGVNARHVTADLLPEKATLCTVDVSFISVRLVLEPVAMLLAPGADLVVLVKPQFEVGRGRLGKGGIVRDPESIRRAVRDVISSAASLPFAAVRVYPCPILGGDGNREVFIHFSGTVTAGALDEALVCL